MPYTLSIKRDAEKYIKRLDRPTALRIRRAIINIGNDPTIGEPLTNHDAGFKYRVGSYRILYDVYEEEVVVDIVKVGPRGDVYN